MVVERSRSGAGSGGGHLATLFPFSAAPEHALRIVRGRRRRKGYEMLRAGFAGF